MEIILDKEKMEAMKALADTNMKVSEAKASLAIIKALESSYLAAREKKALEAVEKVVQDSVLLAKEALGNYEIVVEMYKAAQSFASELKVGQESLSKSLSMLESREKEWLAIVDKAQNDVDAARFEISTDKVRLKNDRESLQRDRDKINLDARKMVDERATLDRAITRLKQGRI